MLLLIMITHPLQQKLQVSGDLKGLSEVKIQNTMLTKKNILKTQFSQFITVSVILWSTQFWLDWIVSQIVVKMIDCSENALRDFF